MELFLNTVKQWALPLTLKVLLLFSDTTQYLRMESTDSNIIANGLLHGPLIL